MVIASAQHLPAAQYPAGVDPSLCPGYPNCDNALLHNAKPQPRSQPSWAQPQPQWSAPAQNWNSQPSAWNYRVPQWQQPAAIYEPVSNDLSGGDKYIFCSHYFRESCTMIIRSFSTDTQLV